MIEIVCQGKSSSEAKAKCMVAELLLTRRMYPIYTTIDILKTIGGISIIESEVKE